MTLTPESIVSEAKTSGPNSALVGFLLIIVLIGVHLRVSLYSGGSLIVPMYPALLGGIVLAFLFRDQIVQRAAPGLMVLVGLVLSLPLVTQFPGGGYSGTLMSSFQLLASIVAALGVIAAVVSLGSQRARRLFFWFWLALIVLAILETIGLRSVFEGVKTVLYAGSDRGVYSAESRDAAIYGKIRPTALASEPSFLADSYMCLIVLIFLVDKQRGSKKSWAVVGVMTGVSFLIGPSFKDVFYLLALLVWQLWPRTRQAFAGLIIALPVAGAALLALASWERDPLGAFGIESTGSFFGRIAVAPKAGLEALWQHPLFGFGLGNTDGFYPLLSNVWQETGAFARFPWYADLDASQLMSNGFWWQWVFLGGLGGIVFLVIITKILGTLGVAHPMRSMVCAWIVWYAGAAFVDPQSWFIVAVFSVGAATLAQPTNHASVGPRARYRHR